MTILRTDRLVLRPFFYEDAPQIARYLNNWNVARWLSVVPFPYTVEMARDFILSAGSHSFCIEFQGAPVGALGIRKHLGYWLAEPFWGQGIVSEAAGLVVANWFATQTNSIISGHFIENTRSARVLEKIGFENRDIRMEPSIANGRDMAMQYMELTHDRWSARHD